jgi:hypothetical protein
LHEPTVKESKVRGKVGGRAETAGRPADLPAAVGFETRAASSGATRIFGAPDASAAAPAGLDDVTADSDAGDAGDVGVEGCSVFFDPASQPEPGFGVFGITLPST